jgi:hypothetical protein
MEEHVDMKKELVLLSRDKVGLYVIIMKKEDRKFG